MVRSLTLNVCTWCGQFRATTERQWTGKTTGTVIMGQVCSHCWSAFLEPKPKSKCGCRTHSTLRKLHSHAR